MTSEDARQIISTRFKTQWEVAYPTVPIFWAGVSSADLSQQKSPFVVFKVGNPRVEQGDLSATPIKRYNGTVEVALYVPEGQGTKKFFEMTDVVTNALAIQVVSGVKLRGLNPIDRTPAVGWQCRILMIHYLFDSID